MATIEIKRAFTVKIPPDEGQAVVDEAEKLGISITMLFRMWVREALMSDPIKFTERV